MDNLNFWPYTDIHELNLDWILEKVKALDTKLNDDIDTYVQEYIDEHFEDWTVNANYDANTQTIVYTNGTGAQQTLGDVIRFAIDNVFVDVKDPIARTAAGAAQTTADDAVLDAAAAQGTADNNTGSITTINNTIGTATLSTDAQTLTGAVNELNSERLYEHIFTATTTSGGYVQIPNFTTDRVIPVYAAVQNAQTETFGYYAIPYGSIFNPWMRIFTEAGEPAASLNVRITLYHFRNIRILED